VPAEAHGTQPAGHLAPQPGGQDLAHARQHDDIGTGVVQFFFQFPQRSRIGGISSLDSAGGNLALALMISLRDRGEGLPMAAALFSPATDFAGTGHSLQENGRRDAMFRPEILAQFRIAYLGDADPRHPLVSPLYADLKGLPPLFIEVGQSEVLRDDAVRLAERAKNAGVHAELKVWPVVPHVWQMADTFIPEARRSLDAAANFLHGKAAAVVPAAEPKRVREMSQ
jgi:hypothetical protein